MKNIKDFDLSEMIANELKTEEDIKMLEEFFEKYK